MIIQLWYISLSTIRVEAKVNISILSVKAHTKKHEVIIDHISIEFMLTEPMIKGLYANLFNFM